jgi:hypothetical protein
VAGCPGMAYNRGVSILKDYQGNEVRLTPERLGHILDHPEMVGLERWIEETLISPEWVFASISDDKVRLFYRRLAETRVGVKLLCVVVKYDQDDAFILTSYLTDKPKKGDRLWPDK